MSEPTHCSGAVSSSAIAKLMQKVTDELNADRDVQAVRLFADGLDHGIVPPGVNLVHWVINAIGKAGTSKLLKAYARHPCFYCKNGVEPCEACKGQGYWQDDTLCETCVTTGVARCDFCNGTGFVTFNAIPADLRLLAAFERVKFAAGRTKVLVDRPAPRPSQSRPHECLKQCVIRLIEANRLMGVFENAVILVREISAFESGSRSFQLKIMKACRRYAPLAHERIHGILQCMSVCTRIEATIPRLTPRARNLANRRRAFLDSLLEPSSRFTGTALEHRFLFANLDELTRMLAGNADPQQAPVPVKQPAATRPRSRK